MKGQNMTFITNLICFMIGAIISAGYAYLAHKANTKASKEMEREETTAAVVKKSRLEKQVENMLNYNGTEIGQKDINGDE